MKPAGLKSAAELAKGKPHGTRVKYMGGCHCVACRAANSRYSCERERRIRAGEGDPIISAEAVRKHLDKLSRQGIGRRAVAAATDIPQSTLHQLRLGKRKGVRKSNALRILAVNSEARSDASYVPAGKMWIQIDELVNEGYTRKDLAARLGYKNGALQFRKDRVLAKTALKVKRLYNALMGDEWRGR